MRRGGTVLLAGLALFAAGCSTAGGMSGMSGCGMGGGGHRGDESIADVRPTAVCPVCRSALVVSEKTPRATYHERHYYFVSEDHEQRFLSDPERYLEGATTRAPTRVEESTAPHQHPPGQ